LRDRTGTWARENSLEAGPPAGENDGTSRARPQACGRLMELRNARKISDVVSIQRSPEELCRVWQDPAELARIAFHLLGRLADDECDLHANDSGPIPEVEVVAVEVGRRVAWQARVGGEIRCRGVTEFTPAPPGRGTELRVVMELEQDGHLLERALEKFQGNDPRLLLREDLRNFKQLMETGEFATTRGQPAGKRSFLGRHLVHAIQEKLQRELTPLPDLPSRTRTAEKHR